jgi:hypothetical protein
MGLAEPSFALPLLSKELARRNDQLEEQFQTKEGYIQALTTLLQTKKAQIEALMPRHQPQEEPSAHEANECPQLPRRPCHNPDCSKEKSLLLHQVQQVCSLFLAV